MINKDTLLKYFRIMSGCDVNPNNTLVDFSLNDESRNVINLVNEEAKKDRKLAALLDDLKYSNNKVEMIEKYFDGKVETKVSGKNVSGLKTCGRMKVDNYGFINMTSLVSIIGVVVVAMSLVIAIATK